MTGNVHMQSFQIFPIGHVRRNKKRVSLEIIEQFRPALRQLEHFSHVNVFWWAHKHDNQKSRSALQCEPSYAKGRITGIFATRAEYRPNPIAVTTCIILKIDEHKEP